MTDKKRIDEARRNFDRYLSEGMIKKERNETAYFSYLRNSDLSLRVAEKLMKDELKPWLWVIVCSYYSMFYAANAVFLKMGYKTGKSRVHQVTSDALIVLVLSKLRKELVEEYEKIMKDALEIASARAEDVIKNFDYEKEKRSGFQYEMDEEIKEGKARTSLQRAKEFVFELRKLLK